MVELGNLWPGQGGVYIWAYRTMGETWGFIGGYLSWVPVILNAASSPAIVLQFLLLAFHAELGLTDRASSCSWSSCGQWSGWRWRNWPPISGS